MDWVGFLVHMLSGFFIFIGGFLLHDWYRDMYPKFPIEYIVASAVLLKDYEDAPNGGPYKDSSYRTALRHHIIYRDYNDVSKKSSSQGFITNGLRFVSREEAAQIAYRSGQISYRKKTLCSEDLW